MVDYNFLTDLPQILIGGLGRPPGMFLAWLRNYKFSGLHLIGKLQLSDKTVSNI